MKSRQALWGWVLWVLASAACGPSELVEQSVEPSQEFESALAEGSVIGNPVLTNYLRPGTVGAMCLDAASGIIHNFCLQKRRVTRGGKTQDYLWTFRESGQCSNDKAKVCQNHAQCNGGYCEGMDGGWARYANQIDFYRSKLEAASNPWWQLEGIHLAYAGWGPTGWMCLGGYDSQRDAQSGTGSASYAVRCQLNPTVGNDSTSPLLAVRRQPLLPIHSYDPRFDRFLVDGQLFSQINLWRKRATNVNQTYEVYGTPTNRWQATSTWALPNPSHTATCSAPSTLLNRPVMKTSLFGLTGVPVGKVGGPSNFARVLAARGLSNDAYGGTGTGAWVGTPNAPLLVMVTEYIYLPPNSTVPLSRIAPLQGGFEYEIQVFAPEVGRVLMAGARNNRCNQGNPTAQCDGAYPDMKYVMRFYATAPSWSLADPLPAGQCINYED